jgi:hypothetical protein
MHFVEVGACQGLKPKAHPKHLRGAEAPLFHGKTALVAFFSNLLRVKWSAWRERRSSPGGFAPPETQAIRLRAGCGWRA